MLFAFGGKRSAQTIAIEQRLKAGDNLSSIAREIGVSRQRVQNVKRRMLDDYSLVTATGCTQPPQSSCTPIGELTSHSPMKQLILKLTPAVHDALVEACEMVNRQNPEESTTLTEYVEELVINRVVELGLLRRNKRK